MNRIPNTIFQQQANIYGLDFPEKISMQVDCGNTPMAKIQKTIQNFKMSKDNGEFESIILIGLDDDSIEQSFDFSSMIKAIEINPSKNENRRYAPHNVRTEFLNKIREL